VVVTPVVEAPAAQAPAAVKSARVISYGIVARNRAAREVSQSRVGHTLPAGARFLRAEPPADLHGRQVVWTLSNLSGEAHQRLTVWVELAADQELPADAVGVFHTTLTYQTRLVRPRLTVAVTGPASVPIEGAAAFQVELANRGTGPATNLVVKYRLSAGLHHPRGDQIKVKLQRLEPDEVTQLPLTVTAGHGGSQTLEVSVEAEGGYLAAGKATVQVLRPALLVQLKGPATGRVQEPFAWQVEVSNPGTAPAAQVELVVPVPAGLEFVSCDRAGRYDMATRQTYWQLEQLPPAEAVCLTLRLRAPYPGDFSQEASARAGGGLEARGQRPFGVELATGGTSNVLAQFLAEIDQELAASDAADRAEDLPVRQAAGSLADQHVVFALAGTDYAVPIRNVLETGRPLAVTPVPNVPEWLLGVANVRGDIVSMVSLRTFLGLEPGSQERQERLLVVRSQAEDLTAGLLVDEIKGICSVPGDRVEAPASPLDDRVTTYLRGITKHKGRLLAVLDLDRLLLSPEMRQFELV